MTSTGGGKSLLRGELRTYSMPTDTDYGLSRGIWGMPKFYISISAELVISRRGIIQIVFISLMKNSYYGLLEFP